MEDIGSINFDVVINGITRTYRLNRDDISLIRQIAHNNMLSVYDACCVSIITGIDTVYNEMSGG